MPKKPTDPKIATYREYKAIQYESYRCAMRAIGTPFYDRAHAIHSIASDLICEYQANPESHLEQLDRLEMTPLSNFLCDIIAMEGF